MFVVSEANHDVVVAYYAWCMASVATADLPERLRLGDGIGCRGLLLLKDICRTLGAVLGFTVGRFARLCWRPGCATSHQAPANVSDICLTSRGSSMVQVTARLPDALGAELDAAAQQLNRCRADIIRQAIEYYLDDIEDLRCGVAALKDPADPVLDWAEVRDALLAAD